MNCTYCHKPCLFVRGINHLTYELANKEGNYWICNSRKCPVEDVSFFTDKRDDLLMVTTIQLYHKAKRLSIVLNWVTKETIIRPWLQREPLVQFPHIVKFTPKNAQSKLATILTFG